MCTRRASWPLRRLPPALRGRSQAASSRRSFAARVSSSRERGSADLDQRLAAPQPREGRPRSTGDVRPARSSLPLRERVGGRRLEPARLLVLRLELIEPIRQVVSLVDHEASPIGLVLGAVIAQVDVAVVHRQDLDLARFVGHHEARPPRQSRTVAQGLVKDLPPANNGHLLGLVPRGGAALEKVVRRTADPGECWYRSASTSGSSLMPLISER